MNFTLCVLLVYNDNASMQTLCTYCANARYAESIRKFYGRYGDLTKQYEVPLSRMLHDILDDDHIQ